MFAKTVQLKETNSLFLVDLHARIEDVNVYK